MKRVAAASSLWTWTCYSPAALENALEEYCEYDGGQGMPVGGDDEHDRLMRIYSQNLAIDKGMVVLALVTPYGWNLLDGYYRRSNLHNFRRGWVTLLRALEMPAPQCPGPVRCRIAGDDRLELPACKQGNGCETLYRQFEEHRGLAIEALFAAIQRRQERTT